MIQDQIKAGKNFKAPKDYKPLSTKQKFGMVAGVVGPGKVIKAVSKTVKIIKAETKIASAAQKAKETAKATFKVTAPKTPKKTSVTKIPSTKGAGGNRNMVEEWRVAGAKSGSDARDAAKAMERWNNLNPKGKKPTIKINTNPYKGK